MPTKHMYMWNQGYLIVYAMGHMSAKIDDTKFRLNCATIDVYTLKVAQEPEIQTRVELEMQRMNQTINSSIRDGKLLTLRIAEESGGVQAGNERGHASVSYKNAQQVLVVSGKKNKLRMREILLNDWRNRNTVTVATRNQYGKERKRTYALRPETAALGKRAPTQ